MFRSRDLTQPDQKLGATVAATLLLAACQTTPVPAPVAANKAATVLASAPVLRQDAFNSIYEVAAAEDGGSVFVATISGFDAENGGIVNRLDARTLQTVQLVHVPRRSFALGLNNTTSTLYVGNTLDGSLSVLDAGSGFVKGMIQLAKPEKNDKGEAYFAHTRKIIIDEKHDRVFVTSPGEPGLIWIVDGISHTLTHTITSEGIWTTGAVYDEAANILYVSQGGKNEILAIDPDAGKVVRSFSTGDSADNTADGSKHFFINLALDAQGQRLLAVDSNTAQLYVLDIVSGKFVQTAPIGGIGALDVVYSAQRNEVFTTHRGISHGGTEGTGAVTVFHGSTLAVKRRIDLPAHPNSLALSSDGQTLYVTVKASQDNKHPAFRRDSRDSVVRMDLNIHHD